MCHLLYTVLWIHYEIGLNDLGILYESLCTLIQMNKAGERGVSAGFKRSLYNAYHLSLLTVFASACNHEI